MVPDLPPPSIKFYKAGREIREDSRSKFILKNNLALLQIQKSRFTDEAKYTLTLEQDGVVVDKCVWSVFIKGMFNLNNFLHDCETSFKLILITLDVCFLET